MSDEKVIHAFPTSELPENVMAVEPRRAGDPYFCAHPAIRLNEHDRTVHCAKCGAALDPFNFLLHETKTIQRAWESHRHVTTKVNELNERVTVLAKEEKRLRAQVKRLQEKSGEVVQVRGKSIL
jgi:hypothetical protein